MNRRFMQASPVKLWRATAAKGRRMKTQIPARAYWKQQSYRAKHLASRGRWRWDPSPRRRNRDVRKRTVLADSSMLRKYRKLVSPLSSDHNEPCSFAIIQSIVDARRSKHKHHQATVQKISAFSKQTHVDSGHQKFNRNCCSYFMVWEHRVFGQSIRPVDDFCGDR